MQFRVRHTLKYRYTPATRGVVHAYRLNPRNYDGQHVSNWQIDVDVNCRMKFGEDGFGNLTQSFSAEGLIDAMTVSVECDIDTHDTSGVVSHAVERFPPELYLRSTPLTRMSDELRRFAEDSCLIKTEPLAKLHALLPAVCNAFGWKKDAGEPERAAVHDAADAFAAKAGRSRDLAHVLIVCARHHKIPARFVSGYCLPGDREADPVMAGHCWAEAYAEGYGWIGFDPAIGVCPRETHVRIACGLDWLSAAPARTARMGFADETVDEQIEMKPVGDM